MKSARLGFCVLEITPQALHPTGIRLPQTGGGHESKRADSGCRQILAKKVKSHFLHVLLKTPWTHWSSLLVSWSTTLHSLNILGEGRERALYTHSSVQESDAMLTRCVSFLRVRPKRAKSSWVRHQVVLFPQPHFRRNIARENYRFGRNIDACDIYFEFPVLHNGRRWETLRSEKKGLYTNSSGVHDA